MLSALATKLDTWNGKAKAREFRDGWAAKTRPDIDFFETGKVVYRYRKAGAGPAIVFAADPPATIEFYDDLVDALAGRFTVIVVELPAMGFSAAKPGYEFGFEESAADIADFCEAVAGKRATLAFSCAAGLAGVAVANRRPDLVGKLVLIQTTDWDAFQDWKAARDPKNILGKPIAGQLAMARVAKARMPDWFRLAVGDQNKLAPFCACAGEALENGALWSLASAYQRYFTGDARLVPPAQQPVLAIWGLKDGSHPTENAERAHNLGQSVRLEKLSHVGHFPELEDVRGTAALIQAFAAN